MPCPTLDELPPPPLNKTGWPWTEESLQLPYSMPNGQPWPRITIVTPSYNQGHYFEEAIRSVLLQGYPNLEYIIIDGGSSDNSLEVIKRYEKYFSYWISEPDKGPVDAINKGWHRASGEIIAYLNSDDVYFPGALATIVETFECQCDIKVVCGNELAIDSQGFVKLESKIEKVDWSNLLNLNFISQPATFIRKSLLEEMGGLNLNIQCIFDFELWLRITRTYSIKCISELLAVTRWHDNTITMNRRSEIGAELVQVVTNEIALHSSKLTMRETKKILSRVNRLSMTLHFETNKVFEATKYAATALVLAPTLRFRLGIIRDYFKNLIVCINIPGRKQKLKFDSEQQVYWSDRIKLRTQESTVSFCNNSQIGK